jgi:hypothetical protein
MANNLSGPVPVYLGQLKRPDEVLSERMERDPFPFDSPVAPILWKSLRDRMAALSIWAASSDARE